MKQTKFILFFMLLSFVCKSQINMSYSIGCIGMPSSSVSATEPVYSGAVAINGGACFTLSNGVSTFDNSKIGAFTTSCEVPAVIARDTVTSNISIIAYPNPVVSTVTVKSVGLASNANQSLIGVYDAVGRQVKTAATNNKQLTEGLKMDLSGLKNGVYFIKLNTKEASAVFKIIKID